MVSPCVASNRTKAVPLQAEDHIKRVWWTDQFLGMAQHVWAQNKRSGSYPENAAYSAGPKLYPVFFNSQIFKQENQSTSKAAGLDARWYWFLNIKWHHVGCKSLVNATPCSLWFLDFDVEDQWAPPAYVIYIYIVTCSIYVCILHQGACVCLCIFLQVYTADLSLIYLHSQMFQVLPWTLKTERCCKEVVTMAII